MIIILTIFINIQLASAQLSDYITVGGYVYINGIKTKPDEVILDLSNKLFPAYIIGEAYYEVKIFNVPSGVTGEFLILYNNVLYHPKERIIIKEGVYDYTIDLYIETSDESQPDNPNNIQPKAVAGGPYYEIINNSINFDGTFSYDDDGTIIKYQWDFGDGATSTSLSPTHTYDKIGNYLVILTVTDDLGKTDLDITYAYITETPNNPPTQPVLYGPLKGSANIVYNYTLFSTDIENNSIQYVLNWGDETKITSSHFLENGTIFTANHSWIYPGIYKLTAYTIDENNAISDPTKINVLIDSIYCKNIGYMIDYTNDGFYDLFYSNSTKEETPTNYVSNKYLVDYDNDGYFDYEYDINTDSLSVYTNVNSEPEKSTNIYDFISPLFPYFIFGLVIIVFLIIAVLKVKRFKKTNKKIKKVKVKPVEGQKVTLGKPKIQEKQPIKEAKDSEYDLKKIRDKIDKL